MQRALGLAIKSYREKQSITQEDLAGISGLNRSYIGSVERGERNVSLQNISAIATALKISISTLFQQAEALVSEGSR